MGSKLVLLVDDDVIVRRATRRLLERQGYAVREATNGQEGVDQFAAAAGEIAFVILDVTMPVMGGAEAFAHLRKLDPGIPVIVASGLDARETASAFAGPGVSFLPKPFKLEHLLKSMREILAAD